MLTNGTESVRISLWDKHIRELGGVSEGDAVKVTNVKTKCYNKVVELNSTDFTRIFKVRMLV